MPRRSILDDARTELRNRPTSARALARRAKRLSEFALVVDRETRTIHKAAVPGGAEQQVINVLRARSGLPPIKD